MENSRLEHGTIKIKDLISQYQSGQIVIPESQREYVWKKSRAPKLLDSLYRGFPVSSLLLWQSDDDVRSRRTDPRPSRSALINWLIDGQQRVITLSRMIGGDYGIDVVFNPDTDEFALSNAATEKDSNWYQVSQIFDEDLYRSLRRGLEGPKGLKREGKFEKLRRVLDYEVPLVKMVNHSFTDAVDAFKRINTLGVKLKQEDIESAQVAARHTGFIADEVTPFLNDVRRQGYTRINVMHLFRVCAFLAHPDGRNRTPLHELDRAEVLAAWKKTKRATEEAISLVRSELSLLNMDILWSGALLVPVIALCATLKPQERKAKEIIAWLGAASLLHRYSKATETALDQDLKACRSADPIRALLRNIRKEEGAIEASPNDFKGSLMDRGAYLGMYIACHHKGIQDFYTGGEVAYSSGIDRHHILPRGQFSEDSKAQADCIAKVTSQIVCKHRRV